MGMTINPISSLARLTGVSAGMMGNLLDRECFTRVVSRERKRAERTGESMLLLVLDIAAIDDEDERGEVMALMAGPLQSAIRETDACGWIETGDQVGMIFTGICTSIIDHARQRVVLKVRECLVENLDHSVCEKVELSVHAFPEKRGDRRNGDRFDRLFYPELLSEEPASRINDSMKRCMDIVGSIVALVLFSPLFLIISAMIKYTSPGPVIFRQERLGQFGRPFTFSSSAQCT